MLFALQTALTSEGHAVRPPTAGTHGALDEADRVADAVRTGAGIAAR
ncbi:hypothetical protein HUO13_16240 [Saccharopolyspora erythraea]|nr:hypothetical protein [Saccharopolyspora erythraea]QUH02132.1 hypothetical protein HUO13_16240 [Saccharopolyspora erythraea]